VIFEFPIFWNLWVKFGISFGGLIQHLILTALKKLGKNPFGVIFDFTFFEGQCLNKE